MYAPSKLLHLTMLNVSFPQKQIYNDITSISDAIVCI